MEMRLAGAEHAEAIRAIYNPEVTDTTVTFDMVPRTLDDQLAWIAAHGGAHPAVVGIVDDEVVGFGSLSPFRDKAAYSTTVEDSVYVRRDRQGRGFGKAILGHLVDLATDYGFHAMIARIVGHNGSGDQGRPVALGRDLDPRPLQLSFCSGHPGAPHHARCCRLGPVPRPRPDLDDQTTDGYRMYVSISRRPRSLSRAGSSCTTPRPFRSSTSRSTTRASSRSSVCDRHASRSASVPKQ